MEIIKNTILNTNEYKGRDINSFIFYNDNGEIFKARNGWLQRNEYPTEVDGLELGTIRQARKIDYTKKDNFTISTRDLWGLAYDMYIYVGQGGDIEILKDYETSNNMGDGATWYTRNLIVKSKYNFYVTNYKKDATTSEYKYIHETTQQLHIQEHARIEYTQERINTDKFRHELNEKYNINIYSNEKLKNIYDDLKSFYEKRGA